MGRNLIIVHPLTKEIKRAALAYAVVACLYIKGCEGPTVVVLEYRCAVEVQNVQRLQTSFLKLVSLYTSACVWCQSLALCSLVTVGNADDYTVPLHALKT